MLAARLYGKEDLRIEEISTPEPGPGEILLRVRAVTLCGTDMRMFRNGARGVSAERPLVLGHEIAGVIERVGLGVDAYKEGQSVTVAPNFGCGTCDMCTSGNTQLCDRYQALGIHLDGGFAERLIIPRAAVAQGNVVEIPPGLDFADAAVAEPLSCVYNAAQRYAVEPGDTVLIIGAGPIGLMHARLARLSGAATVYMNDVNKQRLDYCRQIDPATVAVPQENLVEHIRDITRGRGVNVCVTACSAPAAQITALEVAGVNGRVMFFGGLPADRSTVALDTNIIHYKQLVISGTTRSSLAQYRRTLVLLGCGLVRVRDLITDTAPLNGLPAALAGALAGRGMKQAILFP